MGKNSREKKERRLEREQAAREGLPETPPTKPIYSRRSFIKTLVGVGAGAVAAGTAYYATRHEEDHASPASSEYLTLNEAVAVYQTLKRQVEAKWQEAKKTNKPFRIFVLEGHTSHNALAYEIMLMDISKRLGINKMLLETSEKDLSISLDPALIAKHRSSNPALDAATKVLINAVKTIGMTAMGIDNLYAMTEDWANARSKIISDTLAARIIQKYEGKFTIRVIQKPGDPELENPRIVIDWATPPRVSFAPGSPAALEMGRWIEEILGETQDVMRHRRDVYMLEEIKKYHSAIVIIGKNHGRGLLPGLRDDHPMDIAFSVADRKPEEDYIKDPKRTMDQKRALEWANDPANAVQFSGKEFNPEKLDVFIKNVINKANQQIGVGR